MNSFELSKTAAKRLAGKAVLTPLLRSDLLDAELGGRLFIKAECLQRTGSFKFRGAFNKLTSLDAATRNAGVVAFSSGNHGQAVALAARLYDTNATIIMPKDAPAIKIENTRRYGAKIVLYDRVSEDRESIAAGICSETGASLVPPFNDREIMAGQGTMALELLEQIGAAGERLDAVLAGSSGGGLVGGIAAVCAEAAPHVRVHSVEPEGFDDLKRSLELGARVRNSRISGSICDALLSAIPGIIPFEILKAHASPGFVVSDDEVRHAMATAFRNFRLVIEPGGAAALAAVLSGKCPIEGRTVVVVASGGNVDPSLFKDVLNTMH